MQAGTQTKILPWWSAECIGAGGICATNLGQGSRVLDDGFTMAMVAAAHGHFELVRWLTQERGSPGGGAAASLRSVRQQHGLCWLAKAERGRPPLGRVGGRPRRAGRAPSACLNLQRVFFPSAAAARRQAKAQQLPEVGGDLWASSKEFGNELCMFWGFGVGKRGQGNTHRRWFSSPPTSVFFRPHPPPGAEPAQPERCG